MALFSSFGYLGTGALYLFLSLLLLTVWRGRKPGAYLLAACLVSTTWAFILAAGSFFGSIRPGVLFYAEIARAAIWISFLVMLVKQLGAGRYVVYGPTAVWLAILILGSSAIYFEAIPGTSWSLPIVLLYSGLALSLTGLILIEQLYRNSTPSSRWSLKPLVLGVGGLFAFDLFMFAQGTLFRGIDTTTWIARGWTNILFVPFIATAVRRNPTWDLRIFVSRQVVFYSTTIVAVGVYLLAVSLGGYILVRFGGTWGGVARMVFLVGAGLVLIALLFSGTLRARLRVFLSKHFFQNKYDYREEWQRLTSTLSEFEDSSTRQVVIKAIAEIVDSPAGHLWILDADDNAYKLAASYATEDSAPDIATDDPVINFIKREGWLIDLAEYQQDPSVYEDLELPQWTLQNSNAWLIVPLLSRNELQALIMLYKSPGAPALNYEDRDLLKTVGNHIAVHLAQEKSDSLLAEAQQFEAYNRLTAFLMHDLNNLVAQQSLIVKNAEKHKRNPKFIDDAIHTIANSVDRMQSVLAQLKRRESMPKKRRTDLQSAVEAAIDRCSSRSPVPMLEVKADGLRLQIDPEQLDMVLSHLIRNAQDATQADGSVRVVVDKSESLGVITVTDDGAGMAPDFVRRRLFRPFDSTKGSQGMGIGAYQAREFARKAGGDIAVESAPGAGTSMCLTLPLE